MKLKLPNKRIAISLVAVLFAAGGAGTFALSKNQTPRKDVINKVSINKSTPVTSDEPVKTEAKATTAPSTPSQSVEPKSPPTNPSPTPEDNKAKIMDVISAYTVSRGGTANDVTAETMCFDRVFTNANLYSDYAALSSYPLLQQYLAGSFAFNGMTCIQTYFPTQP